MFKWFKRSDKILTKVEKPIRSVSCPILSIWDECAKAFTFPMLDNGYVYLAATRLSLFKNEEDWAIVFEVFGYSPRAGCPDVFVTTISNALVNRRSREDFVREGAYELYLQNNPYNESKNFFPIKYEDWIEQGEDYIDRVKAGAQFPLRGKVLDLPTHNELYAENIVSSKDEIHVEDVCRYFAAKYREDVLATEDEIRGNISNEMKIILQLDDWHHPDLADLELPSDSETFQQLRDVLISGDISRYKPTKTGNTHWRNWPDGGTL